MMTDEEFTELIEFADKYAIPPNPYFPNGINVSLVVDPTVDEIQYTERPFLQVRMNEEDFDEFKDRLREHNSDDTSGPFG